MSTVSTYRILYKQDIINISMVDNSVTQLFIR